VKYVTIPGWRHKSVQTFNQSPPPWFKVHSSMFSSEWYEGLTWEQRGLVIEMFRLASELGNVMPAKPGILGALLGFDGPVDPEPFVVAGFLQRAPTRAAAKIISLSPSPLFSSSLPDRGEGEGDARKRAKTPAAPPETSDPAPPAGGLAAEDGQKEKESTQPAKPVTNLVALAAFAAEVEERFGKSPPRRGRW